MRLRSGGLPAAHLRPLLGRGDVLLHAQRRHILRVALQALGQKRRHGVWRGAAQLFHPLLQIRRARIVPACVRGDQRQIALRAQLAQQLVWRTPGHGRQHVAVVAALAADLLRRLAEDVLRLGAFPACSAQAARGVFAGRAVAGAPVQQQRGTGHVVGELAAVAATGRIETFDRRAVGRAGLDMVGRALRQTKHMPAVGGDGGGLPVDGHRHGLLQTVVGDHFGHAHHTAGPQHASHDRCGHRHPRHRRKHAIGGQKALPQVLPQIALAHLARQADWVIGWRCRGRVVGWQGVAVAQALGHGVFCTQQLFQAGIAQRAQCVQGDLHPATGRLHPGVDVVVVGLDQTEFRQALRPLRLAQGVRQRRVQLHLPGLRVHLTQRALHLIAGRHQLAQFLGRDAAIGNHGVEGLQVQQVGVFQIGDGVVGVMQHRQVAAQQRRPAAADAVGSRQMHAAATLIVAADARTQHPQLVVQVGDHRRQLRARQRGALPGHHPASGAQPAIQQALQGGALALALAQLFDRLAIVGQVQAVQCLQQIARRQRCGIQLVQGARRARTRTPEVQPLVAPRQRQGGEFAFQLLQRNGSVHTGGRFAVEHAQRHALAQGLRVMQQLHRRARIDGAGDVAAFEILFARGTGRMRGPHLRGLGDFAMKQPVHRRCLGRYRRHCPMAGVVQYHAHVFDDARLDGEQILDRAVLSEFARGKAQRALEAIIGRFQLV